MTEGHNDAFVVAEDLVLLAAHFHVDAGLSEEKPSDASFHAFGDILEGICSSALIIRAKDDQQ